MFKVSLMIGTPGLETELHQLAAQWSKAHAIENTAPIHNRQGGSGRSSTSAGGARCQLRSDFGRLNALLLTVELVGKPSLHGATLGNPPQASFFDQFRSSAKIGQRRAGRTTRLEVSVVR